MKWCKKPVVIEAVVFNGWTTLGQSHNLATDEYPQWLHEAWLVGEFNYLPEKNIASIATLEGDMPVSPGDYIIRGVQGELYPCKPDIFEATYEKV